MAVLMSWPPLLTLGAAVGNLYLTWVAWGYRDKPGGRLFTGVAAGMMMASLSLGVGFLVFEPTVLRVALEMAFWVFGMTAGLLWLAFGMVYTGRDRLVLSRPFAGVVVLVAGMILMVITNPIHHLVWSDFRIVESAGAAGVIYLRGPGFFAVNGLLVLLVVTPLIPLLSTLLSYGPLYRSQTAALAITPFFPGLTLIAWMFQLGPVPGINLSGISTLPHMLLDLYAFFWGGMFEFHPATRHIGENAAIDEVGSPVFILDDDHRIINLNEIAADRFGLEKYDVLGEPVTGVIDGGPFDPESAEQTARISTAGEPRVYDIASTPLTDASDRRVGYTVTLHDVTVERQRKQQLQVLNRALRHNLRNDLNAVVGFAELLEAETTSEQRYAARIRETVVDLIDMSEKTREIESFVGTERGDHTAPLSTVIQRAVEEVKSTFPGAVIRVNCAGGSVHVNESVLVAVLRELIENGIEHDDSGDPWVELTARNDGTDEYPLTITVVDNGPGIPDHELAPIREGVETPLEHGSGLGLWLVEWGVRTLDGEIEFGTTDSRGSIATLRLHTAN